MINVNLTNNPVGILARWRKASQVTPGDVEYSLQRQRTRILRRTEQGVDVEGRAFAAYLRTPYTYYPHGVLGRVSSRLSESSKRNSTKRLHRKLTNNDFKRAGVRLTKSGLGIHFPGGYAQFKQWLGRAGVDLRGARAPHMLQHLQVRILSGREGAIGIYAPDKAAIADGHNRGTRHLPQRRFLGASQADITAIAEDVITRIRARLGGRVGDA